MSSRCCSILLCSRSRQATVAAGDPFAWRLSLDAAEQALAGRRLSFVEEGAGRFPQVSGIQYTWDGSQPAGERIVSVEVVAEDGSVTPIADRALAYAARWANRKQRERLMIQALLERITPAELFVMEGVLKGLTSADIADAPNISLNYYGDPHDMSVMIAVIRRALDIVEHWPVRPS